MEVFCGKQVKTRKAHQCFGCAREFPAGTFLYAKAMFERGEIRTYYLCEVCHEYVCRNFSVGEELGRGELASECKESWETLRAELEV